MLISLIMGISKLTKTIKSSEILKKTEKKPFKQSFGTRGRNERPQVLEQERAIENYDYVPVEKKRTLREQKQSEKAHSIFNNQKLSEDEKKFQLKQLINEEKIHKNKFKPDQNRKKHLRDNLLNKTDNKPKEITKNGTTFSQRTDGNYWSDN